MFTICTPNTGRSPRSKKSTSLFLMRHTSENDILKTYKNLYTKAIIFFLDQSATSASVRIQSQNLGLSSWLHHKVTGWPTSISEPPKSRKIYSHCHSWKLQTGRFQALLTTLCLRKTEHVARMLQMRRARKISGDIRRGWEDNIKANFRFHET
jgi:hypothetical protein